MFIHKHFTKGKKRREEICLLTWKGGFDLRTPLRRQHCGVDGTPGGFRTDDFITGGFVSLDWCDNEPDSSCFKDSRHITTNI